MSPEESVLDPCRCVCPEVETVYAHEDGICGNGGGYVACGTS